MNIYLIIYQQLISIFCIVSRLFELLKLSNLVINIIMAVKSNFFIQYSTFRKPTTLSKSKHTPLLPALTKNHAQNDSQMIGCLKENEHILHKLKVNSQSNLVNVQPQVHKEKNQRKKNTKYYMGSFHGKTQPHQRQEIMTSPHIKQKNNIWRVRNNKYHPRSVFDKIDSYKDSCH